MQRQTRTCFTARLADGAERGGRRYHALVSSSTIKSANTSFYTSGGCRDQITSCYNTGSTSTCSAAQSYCNNRILSPLAGNYDVYYVLAQNPDPYPPDLSTYLGSSSLRTKIGAESAWQETNDDVYDNFASTGDWMHNSAPNLETVINAGVRTIIYDGDAVSGAASARDQCSRAIDRTSSSISTVSRRWSVHAYFYFCPRKANAADGTGEQPADVVLRAVRQDRVLELHRRRPICRHLQERGDVLVRPHLWRVSSRGSTNSTYARLELILGFAFAAATRCLRTSTAASPLDRRRCRCSPRS